MTTIRTPQFDERTALIVVDVQNDFADPQGGLYVKDGQAIVPVVNQAVAAAEKAGSLVVYTQDWHPAQTPHFDTHGGTWPVHCVQGTWGAEFHPDLQVIGPVVRKGSGSQDGYSGFTARDVNTGSDRPTDLDSTLQNHGVRDVVVVGLAQDVCVKETALDARRLGYNVTVALSATRAVNRSDGDFDAANEQMRQAGVTLIG